LSKLDTITMEEQAQLVKDYFLFLKLEKGLSDNTIEAYENDLYKLILFSEEQNKTLTDLTFSDFQNFMAILYDLGIAPRSQARILSGIKSYYKFLIVEDKIEDDPTDKIEGPKIGRKLPEILAIEEIDAMIDAIDLSKPEGQRNRAILETLYSCGLRVSELTSLKISDIFSKEGFIKVRGKGDKERLVPIGGRALKEIDDYLQNWRYKLDIVRGHEDVLFLNRNGAMLTRVMIFTIVKNLASLAGIKKDVSPHTFRHSFATHLLEGGANLRVIQDMLGHSSILTTEIYTHLDKDLLRDTIMRFHPRS